MNKVTLSSIAPRYSNLNEKAAWVNKGLMKGCVARNIFFIDQINFLQSITVTEVGSI